MTRKQKKLLIRTASAAILLIAAFLIPSKGIVKALVFLLPYLAVGYTVLIKAGKNIISGRVFDENFLMALATVGAFVIGEYGEAVFVMLFYQVGELFESIAVGKSRKSISALLDLRPDTATVIRDGGEITVSPEEVQIGEIIAVRSGEKIPLDGVITEGMTTLNTSALTGESLPRTVSVGDGVISGCINVGGYIKVKVEKPFSESTASKILELAENSAANKSKTEGFITKFARYYTPIVVISALATAFLPPIFDGMWKTWIYRALSFLVISCPCALVISVPLTYFASMGASSSKGILIKGSGYLEKLTRVSTVVFDKTGTLTEGSFKVTEVIPEGVDKDELLRLTAAAEYFSEHPIARSVREAYNGDISSDIIGDTSEHIGRGVSARVGDITVYAGSSAYMNELGITGLKPSELGGTVHTAVSENGKKPKYIGCIIISDKEKRTAHEAVFELKKTGVEKTVMLTGDSEATARRISEKIGIDEYRAELLPTDKVKELEKIISETRGNGSVVFVGDGVNDAPVLCRADVGAAMGALGSDAAIEAADVVIMDDDPMKVSFAVRIARHTEKIVLQNVVFSLFVKLAVLILSALGIVDMWVAVFADVGVMVLAVLNSLRAMKL